MQVKIGKIELSAKAGESGKLFGTITTKKLAEELFAKLNTEIDKKDLTLNAPINKVGEYELTIKLTSKVKTQITQGTAINKNLLACNPRCLIGKQKLNHSRNIIRFTDPHWMPTFTGCSQFRV